MLHIILPALFTASLVVAVVCGFIGLIRWAFRK
jgi:hypothetical protein